VSVLAVTIFVSMMLALFFVAGFLYHHDFSGGDSVRDSLLPFKPEKSSRKEPKSGSPAKSDSQFPRK